MTVFVGNLPSAWILLALRRWFLLCMLVCCLGSVLVRTRLLLVDYKKKKPDVLTKHLGMTVMGNSIAHFFVHEYGLTDFIQRRPETGFDYESFRLSIFPCIILTLFIK